MEWLELAAASVLLTVVLFAPGAAALRLAGARGLVVLGAAPALSSALCALAALILARTGVRWSLGTVGALLLVAGAGALLLRVLRRRTRAAAPAKTPSSGAPRSPWIRRWLAVAVAVGTLTLAVPTLVGMGSPGMPLQQWDGVFHLNGVALVHEIGVADSLDGLYGQGASVYYPAVWHSMVALVPPALATPVVAGNASTLVIGLGWLLGIAAFTQALFPARPALVPLATVLASGFSMFPTVPLSTLAQWPNGLSVMLIPGAAALAVRTGRRWRTEGARRGFGTGVLALLAALGVAAAHGSGAVGLLVVVGPYALVVLTGAVHGWWRAGHRVALLSAGVVTAALGAGAVLVLVRSPILRSLIEYERAQVRTYPASVLRTLLDTVLSPVPGNAVISAAVVIGAVVLLRGRRHRWLILSGAVVVLLTAIATGPPGPQRALTGLWYSQGARIEAMYPIVAAPLAAVGVLWAAQRLTVVLRRRRAARRAGRVPGRRRASPPTPVLAAVVVLLAFVTSAGFQAPQRVVRFAEAYEPGRIRWGTMLSVEELDLVRRAPQLLDEDAVVLGDPHNGAPFFLGIGGRHVLLPQLGTSAMDDGQALLRARFRDIHDDPEVCRVIRERGVTHFYEDTAGPAQGAKNDPKSPGLRDVDTSTGFTVVATAGTATLFRIDLCGAGDDQG